MEEYVKTLSDLNMLLPMGNHDLLTGLSAIRGSTQFAIQQTPSLIEPQHAIMLQAEHLADGCRRLLRTKITIQVALTSSNFQGRRTPVQLTEVLQEVVSALGNPQNGYNISIKTDIQEDLLTVYAHRDLLYLLLHTPAADALPFRSRQDIRINVSEDNDTVRIVVQPLDLYGTEHLDLFVFFIKVTGGTIIDKEKAHISFTLPKYK